MDLSHHPAIDAHAHNVVRPEVADGWPYVRAFSEAEDPRAVSAARDTLFFRRSLRDVASLLGCAAVEEAVIARRKELGTEALARRCFDAAGLEAVLLDDGFLPDVSLPLSWHASFVRVYRLLRIETVAERLLPACADFDDFEGRFRGEIEEPGPGVVGYKSIVCYRSGLAVGAVGRSDARECFLALKQGAGGAVRLVEKPLLDHLLGLTFVAACRNGLPVQLHTGFGDPDLDLRLANPLHLRGVLDDRRHRDLTVVLLHASYPFTREAGYLANVYPQVYLDFGLAVPFLSVAGMRSAVGQLLELAPVSRLMYSSDAHVLPELFYLGATWARRVLSKIMEEAVADGDLGASEAEEAARGILADNARRLYRLEGEAR